MGVFALIGFPLYYWIWHDLFPQPYENFFLRLVGMLFSLGVVLLKFWPEWMRRYLPYYWYVATLYVFPFFFVFMLLGNSGNDVWLMSTMAAVFLALLVFDWVIMLIQFVFGSVLAYVVFYVTYGPPEGTYFIGEHVPIYLFAVVGAVASNYTKELVNESKRGLYFKVGATIAHELRSPLLAIKMQLKAAKKGISSFEWRARHGNEDGQLCVSRVSASIESADRQVDDSFTIIDMMLMNVNHRAQQISDEGVHQASQCIERAISGFPYKSDSQRGMVRRGIIEDFYFHGSGVLVVHVLYNLMKNAIYYANAANSNGGGEVVLSSKADDEWNRIVVRDNGCGISEDRMKQIFTWFYSDGRTTANAGVGLSFSKMAMESVGGRIKCVSVVGEYTEFVLLFPARKDVGG